MASPPRTNNSKASQLTGIPLEQLIPAPLTVTILLALATAIDTSESWRRAEKSAWSVEHRRWSRASEGGMPALLMSHAQTRRDDAARTQAGRSKRKSNGLLALWGQIDEWM